LPGSPPILTSLLDGILVVQLSVIELFEDNVMKAPLVICGVEGEVFPINSSSKVMSEDVVLTL
jgi:hypothetical protein